MCKKEVLYIEMKNVDRSSAFFNVISLQIQVYLNQYYYQSL